jgi:DNA-binding response OmpR family regulator
MATPRVVVAAPDPGRSAELRAALEATGFAAVHHALDAFIPLDCSGVCAIVVAAADRESSAAAFCRRISARRDAAPILWLTGERSEGPGAGLAAGADATLGPRASAELVVTQVRALARGRERTADLHRRADESRQINDRLRRAYERIDADAELLRRVRRGFLPRSLPEVDCPRWTAPDSPSHTGRAAGRPANSSTCVGSTRVTSPST